MKLKRLLTIFILCSISVTSQGEIFRWTDTNGAIHFSDEKPEITNFEVVQEQSAQTFKSPETDDTRDSSIAPDSPEKAPARALKKPKADARSCAIINIEIDTLKRTEAVFMDNERQFHTHRSTFSRLYQGERSYLDDTQRSHALTALEQQFAEKCSAPPELERQISLAMEKLIKSRECNLLDKYYQEQQQPKYRNTDSDLQTLKQSIRDYCSSPFSAAEDTTPEDLLDPANLLKAR